MCAKNCATFKYHERKLMNIKSPRLVRNLPLKVEAIEPMEAAQGGFFQPV
jgi:hypothetical protein